MPVNLAKYRKPNALKAAIEALTPVKEDKSYIKLRRAFARGTDKWVKAIENGTIRAPRGNPEKFLREPNRKWIALGQNSTLVTVPRVGDQPLDPELICVASADDTLAFLGDLKTAAEEGQFDDAFRAIAGSEGGQPRRRRRRSGGEASAPAAPKTPKTGRRRSRKAK